MEPTIFSQVKAMFRSLSGVLKKQQEETDKRLLDNKEQTEQKMDANNPTGAGSFSMGREEGSEIGESSHAEGYRVVASGNYSHAEGDRTTASGQNSHAEGRETNATGGYSHAEGARTTASGADSHAEGLDTIASGFISHAEGRDSEAIGECSHAEGCATKAEGWYSHAEGYHTIASGHSTHTQGKYNLDDTDGKYAHIVGNGTADYERSNAHTLDWEGNAWYAGTVEGTGMIVKSSTPGSTKRFLLTVDDSGAVTATEIQ